MASKKKSTSQANRNAKSNSIAAGSEAQKPKTRRQTRENAKKYVNREAIYREWNTMKHPDPAPPAPAKPVQVKKKYLRMKIKVTKTPVKICAPEVIHVGLKKRWARRYKEEEESGTSAASSDSESSGQSNEQVNGQVNGEVNGPVNGQVKEEVNEQINDKLALGVI